MAISKIERRAKIKRRVRKNIFGTPEMPRLSIFRSNKEFYAQVIEDVNGKTLASASSIKLKSDGLSKIEVAKAVGAELAKNAKEANIESVVFDRNGFLYHGRIKAFADGAREAGLKF
ncbi:50S ribosomal protein L18 [bacterium SCSIO 12643]|nr:50S ribosomal protein L18 [bacterium SCSIO 12643]